VGGKARRAEVGLQLTRHHARAEHGYRRRSPPCGSGAGGAAAPAPRRANTEASSRVTLFREPSTATQRHGRHAGRSVGGARPELATIIAGYKDEIVTGATGHRRRRRISSPTKFRT